MPTKLQLQKRIQELEDAREAVLQALEKLAAGTTRAEIENARYRALAPLINELGNEESSEWDLGNWFNRRDLAAKLKSNLRPLMIQKRVDKTMDTDEIHDFIEDWVDSSSPQRTLFRPQSEQIN